MSMEREFKKLYLRIELCQAIISRRDIVAEFEVFLPDLLKYSLESPNNSNIAHNLN